MNKYNDLFAHIPAIQNVAQDANHIDVKVVEGDVNLRQFIAGALSYYPFWLKWLYQIRWGFVRLLGMKQEGIPPAKQLTPEEIPFHLNGQAAFFTITAAEEDRFWVAGITESHLTAHLGTIVEPLAQGNRFYVLTIVHYHKWTGPVYFNVIRPFHHIVIGRMAKAGVQKQLPQSATI